MNFAHLGWEMIEGGRARMKNLQISGLHLLTFFWAFPFMLQVLSTHPNSKDKLWQTGFFSLVV